MKKSEFGESCARWALTGVADHFGERNLTCTLQLPGKFSFVVTQEIVTEGAWNLISDPPQLASMFARAAAPLKVAFDMFCRVRPDADLAAALKKMMAPSILPYEQALFERFFSTAVIHLDG